MFVWISPARLRAKHWNIPVSSGRRPLICRLPPTNTLYLGILTGLMGTASLYHTMSGCGVPAEEGEDYFFTMSLWPCSFFFFFFFFIFSCSFTHAIVHRKTDTTNLVPDRGYPPPFPSLHWCDLVALWQTEGTLFQGRKSIKHCSTKAFKNNSQNKKKKNTNSIAEV